MVPKDKSNVPNVAKVATLQNAKTETKVSANVPNVPNVAEVLAMFISLIVEFCKGKVFQNGERIEGKKYFLIFSALERCNCTVSNWGKESNLKLPYFPKGQTVIDDGTLYQEMRKVIVPLSPVQYVHYRETLVSVFGKPETETQVSKSAEVEQLKKLSAEVAKRETDQQGETVSK